MKNIISLPRPWPVPYEVDLQQSVSFLEMTSAWGVDPVTSSSIVVKLLYAALFTGVLLLVIWFSERAIHSPWGRMMRSIRDNEVAAEAMGKDVTRRHLQVFVLGSAVVGIAGGSGNNWGSVLGGLLIGWLWLIVESVGPGMMGLLTATMADGSLKKHLVDSAPHMRLLSLGVILLLVLRFNPRGLIPEK